MLKFVKVEEVNSLGLIVDNNLNWDTCMLPRCWKKSLSGIFAPNKRRQLCYTSI